MLRIPVDLNPNVTLTPTSQELLKLETGALPPGISLVSAPDLHSWELDIRVLDTNPIYADRVFRLKFAFSPKYPIEAPEVVFLQVAEPARPIPLHPHIYSNGIICLDLLDSAGWSPVHNVESVCVSLQSMLTSNTVAERPEGDELFVRSNRRRPRDIDFVFHDDKV